MRPKPPSKPAETTTSATRKGLDTGAEHDGARAFERFKGLAKGLTAVSKDDLHKAERLEKARKNRAKRPKP